MKAQNIKRKNTNIETQKHNVYAVLSIALSNISDIHLYRT